MERIIRWFVENIVAANMLMIFIIVAGIMAIPFLRMEVFPEIEVEIINVSAVYPGASPSATEEAICIPIEQRIEGLEGVEKISSVATQNIGTVTIEIMSGQNISDMLDKIKAEVDAITTFPDDVETPNIQQFTAVAEVITVAVSAKLDEGSLTDLLDDVNNEISSLPEVTYTQTTGKKRRQIKIEVSDKSLQKYDLTFQKIAQAIRSNSINIPSGSIETVNGEILIRAENQRYNIEDFGEIPILNNQNGAVLKLSEISEISDGFRSSDLKLDFNSMPSKLIRVYRIGNQSALAIADAVERYVSEKNKTLPEQIRLTTWNNDAKILRGRIDLLIKNAKYGLFLVVLILALFLRPKLAFWVSLGIPISFMGGFWFMPLGDVSINMLSLFTFILVLGIVVDDAIVVGENIMLFRERGYSPKEAAIKGAVQVSSPVIFAIMTTVVTFAPMLAVEGAIGAIWRIIPLITIYVLFWSLFESLTILPSHLAHSHEKESNIPIIRFCTGKWDIVQSKIKVLLNNFINDIYKPTLNWVINNIVSTISIALSIFILTIGLIAGGYLKFSFFPPIEGDLAIASIEFPLGTPIDITEAGFLEIKEAANILDIQLKEEYPDQDVMINTLATLGYQPMRTKTSRGPGALDVEFDGSHLGEIAIELAPGEVRPISTEEVVRRWRELTPDIPGVSEVSFFSSLFSVGEPVNVQISSHYTEDLLAARDKLTLALLQYPGVFDVKDNYSIGKEELKIKLLPSANNYGINMMMVASQVRQAFYGLEVQSFQRGTDEVKVMLQYPDSERSSIADLEEFMIHTPLGLQIPVGQIAQLELSNGISTIQRKNRMRAINITADVDLKVTTGNNVVSDIENDILPGIINEYPSIQYTLEGEQQEQQQNLQSIGKNFLIALIVVYTLLSILFKSYFQPLVVMSAIPFGLSGAVVGHLIMGINFSIMSLLGIIALSGVVVNDSLVLVDFINRYRKEGKNIYDAILESGPRRFRPIFLTSLTTFVGLMPLLLEKSIQAKFLIPMAISLAFGVIFATFITLLLVPVLYITIEDKILKNDN